MPQASSPNDIHVGRLILTTPNVARLSFTTAEMTDVELGLEPLGGLRLDQWIQKRVVGINAGKLSQGRQTPFIRSYQVAGLAANLFWSLPDSNIQRLEAYRQIEQNVLILGTDGLPEERPVSEKQLAATANDFYPYPATGAEPVPGAGFGVAGGSVRKDFDTNERVEARATVETGAVRQTYDIKTDVFANAAPGTLPMRARKAEAAFILMKTQSPSFSWQTLRNTSRAVAGLRGDEYFFTSRDTDRGTGYTAHAEYEFGGGADDPRKPYLQIVFNAENVPASMPAAELLKMWDGLLNSARFSK